jgi:signal transduction histidine kinase
MTGKPWLDWALLAVSLFNALILLWLGLTVFLNAERRSWGIWLSTVGLLLGAVFFISHTAVLGSGLRLVLPDLDIWWRLGWIQAFVQPFLWYLAVLWYSGYWDRPPDRLPQGSGVRRRQRYGLVLLSLGGLALAGWLVLSNLSPSLGDLAESPAGIPAAALAFTLYTTLCMGLSIDALRHPHGSARLMGELARQRARRWLIATSLVLLGVGLLVGWALVWIATSSADSAATSAGQAVFSPSWLVTLGWFDLLIAGLIAVSILLLGQAVVAYEVFTGQTLPRRGLAQSWRRAVILVAAFSMLASAGLALGLRPVYSLLLSVMMMVAFLALLGWQAFAERQRLIANLRPFAASQGIIDSLMQADALPAPGAEMEAPFQALCANLLETRRAGLFPYGALALLAGPPVFYPPTSPFSPPELGQIAARLGSASPVGLELPPGEANGLVFAVPLMHAAELSGVILLGEKQSGSPYTQEEIEIAQATGERLIDARASAEMARRLIALQRQHLAAGQVADRRARRALHDEILPLVHAVMLNLAGEEAAHKENSAALDLLQEIHRGLASLLQTMPAALPPALAVEAGGLIGALQRTLSDELEGAFDAVEWQIDPQAEALARSLPPVISEVVYSAAREGIRNAARHGRGGDSQYRLCLRVVLQSSEQGGLRLVLEDNGVGLDSRSAGGIEPAGGAFDDDRTGSGHGLALHSTLMAVIGGSLTLSSPPGQRTCLRLEMPREVFTHLVSPGEQQPDQ